MAVENRPKSYAFRKRPKRLAGKWDKTKCVVCYKSVSAAADDAAKNDVLGKGADVKSAGGKAGEDMAGGAKAAEVINLDADDADDASGGVFFRFRSRRKALPRRTSRLPPPQADDDERAKK